jgi:uncharacterized protein (TIGR02996 family)
MEDELLAAIVVAPDDDARREAYAAWLRERGDPRAEIITAGLRAAKDPSLWREADAARALHRATWYPAPEGFSIVQFARGFPSQVFCRGPAFIAGAEAFYRTAPATTLCLEATNDELARIATMPALRFIRRFELVCKDEEAVRIVTGSPHLRPDSLRVGRAHLTSTVVAPILDAGWPLRELVLPTNPLGDAALRELVARAPALELLDLGACQLTSAVGDVLFASDFVTGLRTLVLDDNPLQGTLSSLAACTRAFRLESLKLAGCALGDRDVESLAASPSLSGLVTLDLSRNAVGNAGATSLASAPGLLALHDLDLRENAIGNEGAATFASSLLRLHALGLSGNPIYVPGATEPWTDWDGGIVGEGPLTMSTKQLGELTGGRYVVR